MKRTKAPTKGPKRKAAKPRTLTRSAATGRIGTGEKEAERLARRIVEIIEETPAERNWQTIASRRIKAELLAATSVTETMAQPIKSGWVYGVSLDTDADVDFGSTILYEDRDPEADPPMRYVQVVEATAPKRGKRA